MVASILSGVDVCHDKYHDSFAMAMPNSLLKARKLSVLGNRKHCLDHGRGTFQPFSFLRIRIFQEKELPDQKKNRTWLTPHELVVGVCFRISLFTPQRWRNGFPFGFPLQTPPSNGAPTKKNRNARPRHLSPFRLGAPFSRAPAPGTLSGRSWR